LLLFFIGITNIGFAQNNLTTLFQWDFSDRVANGVNFVGIEKSYPVQLSLPIQNEKRVLPNEFILPTPSNELLTIKVTKESRSNHNNMIVWNGLAPDDRFKHLPQYQNVIVVYNLTTDKFAASFILPEGEFQLLPTPDSTRKIRKNELNFFHYNTGSSCSCIFWLFAHLLRIRIKEAANSLTILS